MSFPLVDPVVKQEQAKTAQSPNVVMNNVVSPVSGNPTPPGTAHSGNTPLMSNPGMTSVPPT